MVCCVGINKLNKKIMNKKKLNKLIKKEVKKQLIIHGVVKSLCVHNWHHLDNHSDRRECQKCGKNI